MSDDQFDFLQEPVDPKDLAKLETHQDQNWGQVRDRSESLGYLLGRITGHFEAAPDEAKLGISMTLSAHELIDVVYAVHAARGEIMLRKVQSAPVKGEEDKTLTDDDLPHMIPVEPMPVGSRYIDPETNSIRCGHCTNRVVCLVCEGGKDGA